MDKYGTLSDLLENWLTRKITKDNANIDQAVFIINLMQRYNENGLLDKDIYRKKSVFLGKMKDWIKQKKIIPKAKKQASSEKTLKITLTKIKNLVSKMQCICIHWSQIVKLFEDKH